MDLRVRLPPLLVTAGAGLLAWLNARALPELRCDFAARPWLAFAGGVAGLTCSALGVRSCWRARTTVNPLEPAAASTLVTSGIYRVTRNPMYLGFVFLLLAELAWLAHPLACLAAPALVAYLNRFQIAPEERALRHCFGPEYDLYTTRVRRWL